MTQPIKKDSVSFECCESCHLDFETMQNYCAKCGCNLCEIHMAAGCCGEIPALSGNEETEQWFQDHSNEMYQRAVQNKKLRRVSAA